MHDEDIILIKDIIPKPKKTKYKSYTKILWLGILLGSGICISIGGMLQHFISNSIELNALLQDTWFRLPWWAWVGPLIFFLFIWLYVYLRLRFRNVESKRV